MNNTFNINRFGLLIRKQWLEYGKLYLIVLGILTGILCTIYGYTYWNIISTSISETPKSLWMEFRYTLFISLGVLFLSLAANHYFAPLGQKPKAILELTLPASTLEKFIVGILYSTLFAMVAYFLIFNLIDWAFVNKLKNEFPNALVQYYDGVRTVSRKPPQYFLEMRELNYAIWVTLFAGPILFSSIFLLGSLYFKKFQYIKTIITTMVFFGIWMTIQVYSGQAFFNNKIATNNQKQLEFSSIQMDWIITAVLLFLGSIIWIIAYTRFKEKEV